ncbi:MAG: tyrosine-type recombinase/integrase [Eubacteriales bacterium]
MANKNYHDEMDKKNILKLREIVKTLPVFCKEYFNGINDSMSTRTQLAYAYDLRVFFEFMHTTNQECMKKDITEYSIEILDIIKRQDILEYMEYLSYYINPDTLEEIQNDERGKSRKLSCLKSFYNYHFKNELIETNPASLVSLPKLHQKEIVRLDPDEVAILLDSVEMGSNLTEKQLAYHEKTKIRDLALLTLLLGTGIRVSECVGLDMNDVDFNNLRIKVRRKGGYEDTVYFSREVESALLKYMEERKRIIPYTGHENALFLSIQNKRLQVRSVEKLVKKYASLVTTLKKITPHKLRSTFGTNLYQETGDIYLVADVLGHSDVNTTKKHYAAMNEDNKRKAASAVKLREP